MKWIGIILFIPIILFAHPVDIKAKKLLWENDQIKLIDDISLSHPLGYLQAGYAELNHVDKSNGLSFDTGCLEKKVVLSLHDSSRFECDKALIDNTLNHIQLFATAAKPILFYSPIHDKPMTIRCLFAQGDYASLAVPIKKAKDHFHHIFFKNDVVMEYDQFIIKSDEATYEITTDLNKILHLKSASHCEINYGKDRMLCLSATCHLNQQLFYLNSPKGSIDSPFFSSDNSFIFSCKKLCVEKSRQTLTLQQNVCISNPELGEIEAEELLLKRNESGELQHIMTKGKSRIYFQQGSKNPCILSCSEDILIDHQKHIIEANRFGSKMSDKPLFFSDNQISVFANTATLNYKNQDGKLKLQDILLDGNVYFFFSDKIKLPGYGLAHKIYYNLETNELVLTKGDAKVIFCKEDNTMKLEADTIYVYPNSEKENETIKASGIAHFSFSLEEQNYIREMFTKYLKQHP